jgi:methyl-accepting chemotaxis protein
LADEALKVQTQSIQVEQTAGNVHTQHAKIAQEMESLAQSTERNMAEFRAMAASMATQTDQISQIQASFLQLDELATELTRMSTDKK